MGKDRTLEIIKTEIERLKSIEYPCDNSQQATGFFNALDRMTDFLSTLESEKPINPDDAMKELDEKIALVKQKGTWDGVDVDKYMDEVRGREPEKPMEQDGLEEELDRFITSGKSVTVDDYGTYKVSYHDFKKVARHFAEWQKEQDTRDMFMSDNRHFNKVYELGKNDMKEQMMKEAVPFYEILEAVPPGPERENVRIIIVKED